MMFQLVADVVWPSLLLSARLWAWWCVAGSIVIEAAALWRFAGVPPAKAALASAVMNCVSGFCGIFLLPVAGLWWEMLASLTFASWFNWGTFNPVSYAATWLIAVLLSTIIEMFVLWLVFFIPWTRRLTVVMLLANAVTVGLAGLTMIFAA